MKLNHLSYAERASAKRFVVDFPGFGLRSKNVLYWVAAGFPLQVAPIFYTILSVIGNIIPFYMIYGIKADFSPKSKGIIVLFDGIFLIFRQYLTDISIIQHINDPNTNAQVSFTDTLCTCLTYMFTPLKFLSLFNFPEKVVYFGYCFFPMISLWLHCCTNCMLRKYRHNHSELLYSFGILEVVFAAVPRIRTYQMAFITLLFIMLYVGFLFRYDIASLLPNLRKSSVTRNRSLYSFSIPVTTAFFFINSIYFGGYASTIEYVYFYLCYTGVMSFSLLSFLITEQLDKNLKDAYTLPLLIFWFAVGVSWIIRKISLFPYYWPLFFYTIIILIFAFSIDYAYVLSVGTGIPLNK